VAAPPEPPTAPVYYCSGAPTYKVVSADVCLELSYRLKNRLDIFIVLFYFMLKFS
jgi:hypothetical protein